MARVTFVVSPVTPDGRPFPASILFDVEYQNDESEKETNGTEITQALISAKSPRMIGDKFELPRHTVEEFLPDLPVHWEVILGTEFIVELPPGHYLSGHLIATGYVTAGFIFEQRLGVGYPVEYDSMTESDETPPDEFNYELVFTEEILDLMTSISGFSGNNFCRCSISLNGDEGELTDFHFRAQYEDIF